jgi:regulator of sigma E protease
MTQFWVSLAAFLLAIGVLITVHEFGHYWVARKMGVKVLRFSIGFGKPLWTKRGGADQTEYVLAAIPLGGYVKMLDEREGEVASEELNRAFNRKSLKARFAIVAAGPIFNLAFAVVAYWIIFMLGVQGMTPIVGPVEANSAAAIAGLQERDRILSVDGETTTTWSGVNLALIDSILARDSVAITVEDMDRRVREVSIPVVDRAELMRDNRLLENLGIGIWRPELPPVIGQVIGGGAAAAAGLMSGDRIISADGEAIGDWRAWVLYVRARPAQNIDLIVNRDGKQLTIELTPKRISEGDKQIGRIGAGVQVPDGLYDDLRAVERYGPIDSIGVALKKTWSMSVLMLRMLGKMVVGEASVENISGPISIAQFAGQSAQIGLVPFLGFLAVVSISLGVLNLLPIPLLDGGHLLYYMVEAVKGSPVSEATEVFGQRIGIGILLALMLIAFYNDLTRILS